MRSLSKSREHSNLKCKFALSYFAIIPTVFTEKNVENRISIYSNNRKPFIQTIVEKIRKFLSNHGFINGYYLLTNQSALQGFLIFNSMKMASAQVVETSVADKNIYRWGFTLFSVRV